MKTSSPKKEIRIKVESRFFERLKTQAYVYGVKPNDYILYLIINDIKSIENKIPYISEESEKIIQEGYSEILKNKK